MRRLAGKSQPDSEVDPQALHRNSIFHPTYYLALLQSLPDRFAASARVSCTMVVLAIPAASARGFQLNGRWLEDEKDR